MRIVTLFTGALVALSLVAGGAAAQTDKAKKQAEVRKATLTINMTHRTERQGVSKQSIERDLRLALETAGQADIDILVFVSGQPLAGLHVALLDHGTRKH